VAIATGAGRGVGKSIALALAEAGADIVVTARTESEIRETADEIMRLGRRSLSVSMDIQESKEVQNMVDQSCLACDERLAFRIGSLSGRYLLGY
jgi:7-alpha-hydroxysteroid dehydrogenase